MKLEIRRSKPKTPQKRVTVPIDADLLTAISAVIDWRKRHTEFIGLIPLHEHLSVKIEEEVLARSKAPNRCFVEHKISLPIDLVGRMKQSDCDYKSKGYMPDWENCIRKYLDILIRNYTSQLEEILGEDPPPELQNYRKKRNNRRRKSVENDPKPSAVTDLSDANVISS